MWLQLATSWIVETSVRHKIAASDATLFSASGSYKAICKMVMGFGALPPLSSCFVENQSGGKASHSKSGC
jgi:hypothetical protein